jgi:3'-phosphoadenosine 5'-phosphosulfate sulfotransferase (PAPS reductase)/FAD synthetase
MREVVAGSTTGHAPPSGKTRRCSFASPEGLSSRSIPFPLHVDTTYKFREMIEFRNWYVNEIGARLIVHTNDQAIADGTQPRRDSDAAGC